MRIAFTRDNSWSTNGFIGSSANHPNPMAKEIFNAKIEKAFIYMESFLSCKITMASRDNKYLFFHPNLKFNFKKNTKLLFTLC